MILILSLSGCAGAQGMSKLDGSTQSQEQAEIKAEKARRSKWVHRFHKEHPLAIFGPKKPLPMPSGELPPPAHSEGLQIQTPKNNQISPRVIVNYWETNNFYGPKK